MDDYGSLKLFMEWLDLVISLNVHNIFKHHNCMISNNCFFLHCLWFLCMISYFVQLIVLALFSTRLL